MLSLLQQMPRLMKVVKREHIWLQELTKSQQIDGIISDNRYGLFHTEIPSVIITHQLQVQTGLGAVADGVLRRLHYRYLERFSACWVADTESEGNLSGKLAHPEVLPNNARYLGLLSQFAGMNGVEGDYLLVLLSGPEPQRSILSEKLWQQVLQHKGRVVFVEGSEQSRYADEIPAHIEYHGRLIKDLLLPLLRNASMVICRSGYSTLMDLVALGKKAIVIPTPGQTEQEYLARHLHHSGIFLRARQQDFELQKALAEAAGFVFKKSGVAENFNQYEQVLSSWVRSL